MPPVLPDMRVSRSLPVYRNAFTAFLSVYRNAFTAFLSVYRSAFAAFFPVCRNAVTAFLLGPDGPGLLGMNGARFRPDVRAGNERRRRQDQHRHADPDWP